MLAMFAEEVYRSQIGIGNAAAGRGLGRFSTHLGQRTQTAEHLIELFRVSGDELQPVAAGEIAFRTDAFDLLPEPTLHALQVKGIAAAGIESLRRPQREPIEFHEGPVVSFRSFAAEDIPFVEDLKRYGGNVVADGNVHGAAVDPPSTLEFIAGGLKRAGIRRGDHDVLVGGNGRTNLQHVVNFMRGRFQPSVVALYTVKHIYLFVSQALRALSAL